MFTYQFVKHLNLTLSVQQSVTKWTARIAINLVTPKALISLELINVHTLIFKHLSHTLGAQKKYEQWFHFALALTPQPLCLHVMFDIFFLLLWQLRYCAHHKFISFFPFSENLTTVSHHILIFFSKSLAILPLCYQDLNCSEMLVTMLP